MSNILFYGTEAMEHSSTQITERNLMIYVKTVVKGAFSFNINITSFGINAMSVTTFCEAAWHYILYAEGNFKGQNGNNSKNNEC